MKIKTLIAACLITMPLMVSAAEISITNNTDNYGTGSINGTCSNIAGDKGVINPGQTLTVPQIAFDMLCFGMDCTADIYLTKNCTGKKVATADIDPDDGILSVNLIDKEHYEVTYSKTSVTVNKKNKFFNLLNF